MIERRGLKLLKGSHHTAESKEVLRKANLGHQVSAETRIKISKSLMGKQKGKVVSEETRKKLSENHAHYWQGKKHSEEHKKRNRESNKGRVFTEEHCQNVSEAKMGHEVSKDTRAKISKANKGKMAKEKNPNWMGGISFNPYPVEFDDNLRDMVRERDGYICQLCGRTQRENGRRLTVHHIDYIKENCNLDNLIALCINCHGEVNADRDYWTDFFNRLMKGED